MSTYLASVALNTAGVPSQRTLDEAAGVTAVTASHYDRLLTGVQYRLPSAIEDLVEAGYLRRL